MKDKIFPTISLTVICVVAALLLTFAHEGTKDSIAKQRELKFSSTVEQLFGDCETKMLDTTFDVEGVKTIAVTSDGRTAVEVVVDGYSKGGIDILVGFDADGKLCGIEFVSLGETPGLGSKVQDVGSFRKQFYGETEVGDKLDAISGATFSSKGMRSAVNTALKVYTENKEAILNG